MKQKQLFKIGLLLSLVLALAGCVEEFDFETQAGFESAIVVEATITNEFKVQEIKLSRTFRLEESGPEAEINASVRVTDGGSTTYTFNDMGDGIYRSTEAFSAQPNRDYQLNITTSSGQAYSSDITRLTASTEIEAIVPTRQTNDGGQDGVALLVDSFDPTGRSKYYKYEYEETYKIVSRIRTDSVFKLVQDSIGNDSITISLRQEPETVCYNTKISNALILTNTSELNEDRVSRFPARFIDRDNPIISSRYSLLLKQYVLSLEAYTFYETLRDFSGSGSLFSQTQPGFINGNIRSLTNSDEKVIGFFTVSSVSEKRIFFDFYDIFPSNTTPAFFSPDCPLTRPGMELLDQIQSNSIRFFRTATPQDPPPAQGEGPYFTVPRFCVDCRFFGSLEVPDFWED